jgi:hypothetical protein
MIMVEIVGWQHGCNSVAAIKKIRTRAKVPLDEALDVVNRVLANEKASVRVSGATDAALLVDELASLGMYAHVAADSTMADSSLSQHP